MAMTKCKECQKDISTNATKCPHCGATKTTSAGIVIAIIIAVVFFLIFVLPGIMSTVPKF